MWLPGIRIFRLSSRDLERDARQLALGRAAIALGRKVLADNPRPDIPKIAIPKIAQHETREPLPQQADDSRMRVASERSAKVSRERKSQERQHLSVADRHVEQAERVIREQGAIIAKLRTEGHDTELAEKAMRAFEANLQVMREHRELIIRALEDG